VLDRFTQGDEEFEICELDHNSLSWCDVSQILELYSSWFHEPAEPPEHHILTRILQRFYRVFYIAHKAGVVVSCALVLEHSQSGVYHLDYLCVRPGMCGSGFGARFFKGIVRILGNEAKYDLLTLESQFHLIPWYVKQGCFNWDIESDRLGDDKWYLLMVPLGLSLQLDSPRAPLFVPDGADPPPVIDLLRVILPDIKGKLDSDLMHPVAV